MHDHDTLYIVLLPLFHGLVVIHKQNMQYFVISFQFHEDAFVLRTKEGHNEQCQRLDQGEHFKKTYGLNSNSLLNNCRFYHVIGGLPADCMHDILEGVLQYCVKELLKVLIYEKNYLTLDELNRRIPLLDYGYHNDTNRPVQIQAHRLRSNDNSLKQHGTVFTTFVNNVSIFNLLYCACRIKFLKIKMK